MTSTIPTTLLKELESEGKRIEEDSLYSSCGHFESAKPWIRAHYLLGIPLTLVSTAAGLVATQSGESASYLASGLAFAVAVGTALMTFLSPSEKQKTHTECGNAYAALRNQARIFHRIECASSSSPELLRDRCLELASKRDALKANSPLISERAFQRARTGIEQGQKTHHVDINEKS